MSPILTSPLEFTSTLLGFTSRCAMPWACMCANSSRHRARSHSEGRLRDAAPAAFVEDAGERAGVHELEHVRDHVVVGAAEDRVAADDVWPPGGPA
jgi:hypothetical protein